MKQARFFVLLFIAVVGVFLLTNFILWNGWVAVLRTNKYAGGDLARLGYLSQVKIPRPYRNDLPVRHLEFSEYRGEKIDVLTIGDSFSNPAGLGVNVYYQDHLATRNNLRVLNIRPMENGEFSPHVSLVKLYNSGELERLKPRYVLIESVERYAIQRLGTELDFSLKATPKDLARYVNSKADVSPYKPRLFDFVTTANFKYLHNNLRYRTSDHNSDENVYITRLRKPFFSSAQGDLLAYWFEDTRSIEAATPEAVAKLNDNLNTLARMLAEKGMTLIFMPAVDKYNLYRDYLIDDSLPRSRFFETLRPLKKDYLFIDTKALLATELAKGEKDVFFADDTHWSAKAGEIIFSRFLLP